MLGLEARAERVGAARVGPDRHLREEVFEGAVAQVLGDDAEAQQVLERVLDQQPRDDACGVYEHMRSAWRPTSMHDDLAARVKSVAV